ncbi:MAG: FG-GAP repeat domain-containing protein, partial [Gemmatimonadaceae bacterium]
MRALLAVASLSMLATCAEQADPQDPLLERAPFSPIVVGHGSGTIVLVDLNRDGHLDLVTQHLLDSLVNVFLGDGKGHFVGATGSPMKLGYQPGTIALGDVNNDSILDLGIANKDSRGEYVDILLGDGSGAFKRSLGSPFRASAAMDFYKPILRLVDVNADGNIDIVTANGRRPTVEVMLGNGSGGFAAASVLPVGAGPGIGSFAIGDVDGDGHLDLVVSNSGGPDLDRPGSLVIKRGDGKGHFTDASHSPLSAPPGAILETLADVNGDGRLDAVIRYGERNVVNVFANEGKGVFGSAPAARIQVEADAFAVRVEDLNRDKIADLIVATVQS